MPPLMIQKRHGIGKHIVKAVAGRLRKGGYPLTSFRLHSQDKGLGTHGIQIIIQLRIVRDREADANPQDGH